MKWLFLSIFSILFFGANAQLEPLPAETVLANAVKQAAGQHKKVFLKFGASWCGWCKRLDATLKTEPAKSYINTNYVVADITVYESAALKNIENKGAEELLKKYNAYNEGLPYFIIFDENGAYLADSQMRNETGDNIYVKGQNVGCPASLEEVAYFISVLKKTSAISNEEAKAIEEQFLNR